MLNIKFKYILVASFFLLFIYLDLCGHNYVPGDSLNILSGDIPLMKDSAPNSEKLGDAPYGAKVLIIKKTNLPFKGKGSRGIG